MHSQEISDKRPWLQAKQSTKGDGGEQEESKINNSLPYSTLRKYLHARAY